LAAQVDPVISYKYENFEPVILQLVLLFPRTILLNSNNFFNNGSVYSLFSTVGLRNGSARNWLKRKHAQQNWQLSQG
jgi:hypothetical protein